MTEQLPEPFKIGGFNPLHPSTPQWLKDIYKKSKEKVSSRTLEQRVQHSKKTHNGQQVKIRLKHKLATSASGASGASNSPKPSPANR